jgi:hypothetical protein
VPKADHVGELKIGFHAIPCAVLPDGTRLLSQRGVGRALGRGHGGKDWRVAQARLDANPGAGPLPFFLASKVLRPFISSELMAVASSPIKYRHGKGGGVAFGIAATALPLICEAWLQAREAGALNAVQRGIAHRAETLMRGLARVGIVALVDEATGYQDVRDRLALQAILDRFLRKELAAWAKRFPDDFYKELFRLREWQWQPLNVKRPGVVAHWTKDLVYERLAPSLLEKLEELNPSDGRGHRKARHHQWLSEEAGHPSLAQHLHAVTGLMRASTEWNDFYRLLQRAFPKKGTTLLLTCIE